MYVFDGQALVCIERVAQCLSLQFEEPLPTTAAQESRLRTIARRQQIESDRTGEATLLEEERYWQRRLQWERLDAEVNVKRQKERQNVLQRQQQPHAKSQVWPPRVVTMNPGKGPVQIDSHGSRFDFHDGTLHYREKLSRVHTAASAIDEIDKDEQETHDNHQPPEPPHAR